MLKPGTHDASNYANCLANGDARKTSNICTCKRRLRYLTSMEHASMLSYARKLKIFEFFGACDAEQKNSQCLNTLVKVLWLFYPCYECIIRKQTIWILWFLPLAFIKLASFVLHLVWISILACSQLVLGY